MPGVVRVELVGPLRSDAGGLPYLEVEVEGRKKVLEVINRLPDKVRRRVLDESGRLASGILLIVNGVEVSSLGGLSEVWVKPGDTIALIQAIHGGLG